MVQELGFLPQGRLRLFQPDETTLVVTSDSGVYASVNEGKNWKPYNLPERWARDLAGCAIASGSASRPVMDNARLDLTITLRATAPMCPDAGACDGAADAPVPDAAVDARGPDVIPQCNMPGQRVCAGAGASGTCDDMGNIVIDRTCPPGSTCAIGYCRPPPGADMPA